MFGIGFGELLILAAIGILILGPERCVQLARTIGRNYNKLQSEWRAVKKDISDEQR